MSGDGKGRLDPALAGRVARMSGGSQRWLRTALQAILANDEMMDVDASVERPAGMELDVGPFEEKTKGPEQAERLPDLEDVLMGKSTLEEQLEAYPELAEELDGLTDIVDLLREAGERRRKRGEQILREEILGDEPEEDEPEEEEDRPDDPGAQE